MARLSRWPEVAKATARSTGKAEVKQTTRSAEQAVIATVILGWLQSACLGCAVLCFTAASRVATRPVFDGTSRFSANLSRVPLD